MSVNSQASRVEDADPARWFTTSEALEMATAGSARARGWGGRLGRFEPGYKADLVFLDARHVNYVPLNDPVNQIVHVEDGTGVRRVMIGGRVVVEDGRLTTVDMGRIRARAQAAADRLAAATADARRVSEQLEPWLIGACRALAAVPTGLERTDARRG